MASEPAHDASHAVVAVRGERRGVDLRRAVVATDRARAADEQFTGLAIGHYVAVRTHDLDLVVFAHPTAPALRCELRERIASTLASE